MEQGLLLRRRHVFATFIAGCKRFLSAHRKEAFLWAIVLSSVLVLAAAFAWARKDVSISVDGKVIKLTTTYSRVSDVLHVAGVQLYEGDVVSPGFDEKVRDGATITIKRALPVTVIVGGRKRLVRSASPSVGSLLEELKIALGPKDRVIPAQDAPLEGEMIIQVVRVQEEKTIRRIEVPYRTEQRIDKEIDKGMSKVIREGSHGLKEQQVLITYENGKKVKEEIISEKLIVKPVNRLVIIGGRNPLRTLHTSRGTYRYRDRYRMLSTAYDPGPKSCGRYADGYTAIGVKAQRGVAAVDPRVIPLKTRLYVEGYGLALAADVGSAIKGNRIDLCFDTHREALKYGRRWVDVYVLEP